LNLQQGKKVSLCFFGGGQGEAKSAAGPTLTGLSVSATVTEQWRDEHTEIYIQGEKQYFFYTMARLSSHICNISTCQFVRPIFRVVTSNQKDGVKVK
jgi:hypothetical protein